MFNLMFWRRRPMDEPGWMDEPGRFPPKYFHLTILRRSRPWARPEWFPGYCHVEGSRFIGGELLEEPLSGYAGKLNQWPRVVESPEAPRTEP